MKSLWNDITSTAAIRTGLVGVLALLALFLLVQSIATIQSVKNTTAATSISVSGEGTATAVPDTAQISFGTTETAADVATAQTKVNTTITNAFPGVKASGVSASDITTTSFNVSPHYNPPVCQPGMMCPQNAGPTISGYDVSEDVSVKIHDVSKVSEILASLAKVQKISNVSGPNFIVGDTQAVETLAQVNAIKNAQASAQKIADQLHVRLGRIVGYYDNSNGDTSPTPSMASSRDSVMSAGVVAPVVPVGENTYTKDVSVTYEIR